MYRFPLPVRLPPTTRSIFQFVQANILQTHPLRSTTTHSCSMRWKNSGCVVNLSCLTAPRNCLSVSSELSTISKMSLSTSLTDNASYASSNSAFWIYQPAIGSLGACTSAPQHQCFPSTSIFKSRSIAACVMDPAVADVWKTYMPHLLTIMTNFWEWNAIEF